ncbi:copper resistance CopC family protein [Brachybacterium epidermidis]|uniref:copper resistance CopC family protein n=1 Tax=Brachybacterium epidermidis TaxID=2781983 RepID=UPI0032B705EB
MRGRGSSGPPGPGPPPGPPGPPYGVGPPHLRPAGRLPPPAGGEISPGPPAVSGNTATIDLPPLPADDYQVLWRVVSSDGHPIEGTVDFTVTVGAEPTATADSESEEPKESEEPTAGTDEPSTEDTAAEPAEAQQSEGGLPLGMILGGLALLLLLAAIGAIIVRLRRSPGDNTD